MSNDLNLADLQPLIPMPTHASPTVLLELATSACWWCGHQFTPYETRADHWLWCGKRPADA